MILALILRHRIPLAFAAALLGLLAASWHYRSAYHAEKALRQADRAAYGQAQAEAALIAEADVRAREQAMQARTIKIEDERNELQDRFSDMAARYRAANRVRSQAAQSVAGVVPSAAEDHGSGLRAPTSEAADMVAITGDDFNRCTVTAGDYVKLREWALGLAK